MTVWLRLQVPALFSWLLLAFILCTPNEEHELPSVCALLQICHILPCPPPANNTHLFYTYPTLPRLGPSFFSPGLLVDDARQAYEVSVANGAKGGRPPTTLQDSAGGCAVVSEVSLYGDVVLRYISGDWEVRQRGHTQQQHKGCRKGVASWNQQQNQQKM